VQIDETTASASQQHERLPSSLTSNQSRCTCCSTHYILVGSARAGARRWTMRARKFIMSAREQPAPQRPMSACLDMGLGEAFKAFVYRTRSMLTNESCGHPGFRKWASPFVLDQRAVVTTSIQAIDHREHCAFDLHRYGSQYALSMFQEKMSNSAPVLPEAVHSSSLCRPGMRATIDALVLSFGMFERVQRSRA